jgi:hypothetical protein
MQLKRNIAIIYNFRGMLVVTFSIFGGVNANKLPKEKIVFIAPKSMTVDPNGTTKLLKALI